MKVLSSFSEKSINFPENIALLLISMPRSPLIFELWRIQSPFCRTCLRIFIFCCSSSINHFINQTIIYIICNFNSSISFNAIDAGANVCISGLYPQCITLSLPLCVFAAFAIFYSIHFIASLAMILFYHFISCTVEYIAVNANIIRFLTFLWN